MRVRFIVYLKEALAIEKIEGITSERDAQPELRPELRPELMQVEKIESPLAIKVTNILRICDMGMSELAEQLGHKTVSGELKKQVRHLLKMGYIEMTIPDKPKSKNQKYKLTAKGRALVSLKNEDINHGRSE